MTDAAGGWKCEHGPQLPPGPDVGHAWSIKDTQRTWQ